MDKIREKPSSVDNLFFLMSSLICGRQIYFYHTKLKTEKKDCKNVSVMLLYHCGDKFLEMVLGICHFFYLAGFPMQGYTGEMQMECLQKSYGIKGKIKHLSMHPAETLGVIYAVITASIIVQSSFTLVYSFCFDLKGEQNSCFTPEFAINLSSLDEFIGIGSLVFIIWTFSTGLIVTFLGAVNDKRYGIRIIDLVLAGKCALLKLVVLAILFLLELIVLFKAILLKREITLVLCLKMQICWMVYFFLMICFETSEQMIKSRVANDTVRRVKKSGGAGPLLYKMIRNLEYEDTDEMEKFFCILEKIEEKCRKIRKKKIHNKYLIQDVSAFLTECMLKRMDDRRKAVSIIGSWLRLGDGYINIKQGIFQGLLDNAYESFCPDIEEMLDINFQGKREVILWAAAYNLFYADKKVGQGYRMILSDNLLGALDPPLNGSDLTELFQVWRGFSGADDQNDGLIDLNLEILWKLIREEMYR